MARRPGFVSSPVAQRAMARLGLSRPALAARLEVSPGTVRNWLSGRTAPLPAKLAELARLLEVDVRDLTGVSEDRETLADLRIHAALTQGEASAAAGMPQSSLSDIEQGVTRLTDASRAALAQAYGAPEVAVAAAWQRARDTLTGGTRL